MGEEKNYDKPTKSWFAVFNNPRDHGYSGTPEEICERLKNEWIEGSPTRTGAWLYCISADGLEHVHMVLEDIKAMRFTAIKKEYAQGMHFSPTRGNKKQVEDYINKVGEWEEKGEKIIYTTTYGEVKGAQGRRNDLNRLYDLIRDGFTDFQILEENPQYMKYLDKIAKVRETLRYEEFKDKRRTDLHVEYWYGDPGTGKTSGVLNMYGDSKVYMVSDYVHPWDDYQGEDVVLFDDFDSNRILLNDLLRWIDIYPVNLRSRYSNKVACFTKVYFTSNFSPEEQWSEEYRWHKKEYDALMRRIHVVKRFRKGGIVGDEKETDADGFLKVSPEQAEQLEMMFGK